MILFTPGSIVIDIFDHGGEGMRAMAEDQQFLDAKRRFSTELSQVIKISGLSQRELASALGIRRSTMSDILLGKQRNLPNPSFLASLLTKCGKSAEEIEGWQLRRADIIRLGDDGTAPDAEEEIERLATKLDETAGQLAELQDTERRLRDALEATIIERDQVNSQLAAERRRSDYSQAKIATLEARADAAESRIEQLNRRLSETAERLWTAERLVVDLRADLMAAEDALEYEEYSRSQSSDPPFGVGRADDQAPAYSFGSPVAEGPSIRDLRNDLDAQQDVITQARAMCLNALQMLGVASQNLTNILYGTAAIIAREQLPQYMTAASEELTRSLQCMNEFAHRLHDLRVVTEAQIAGIAELVEHCGYGVTECLRTLDSCRDTLSALVTDETAGELGVIVEVASRGLDSCLGAIASATQAIDEYSAAL